MLAKLELINFRSHKHTIIDFVDGVNVFIGRGQAGKTNIKRALQWLVFNRPLGNKVHSFWMEKDDTTEVIAHLKEGYKIIISKQLKGSVQYRVTYPDSTEQCFEKIGKQIPDDIQTILALNNLNFQDQLDQPYLITATLGDIARSINQVIDLDIADDWISELNSRKRKNKIRVLDLATHQAQAETTLQFYDILPKASDFINRAGKVLSILDDRRTKIEILEKWLGEAYFAQSELTKADCLKSIDKIIDYAQVISNRLQNKKQRSQHIQKLLRVIYNVSADCLRLESVDTLQNVIDDITDTNNLLLDMQNKIKSCEYVIECYRDLRINMSELEYAEARYIDALKETGKCPICDRPLNHDILEKIKESI